MDETAQYASADNLVLLVQAPKASQLVGRARLASAAKEEEHNVRPEGLSSDPDLPYNLPLVSEE